MFKQSTLLSSILAVALLTQACNRAEVNPTTSELNKPFSLAKGESTQLKIGTSETPSSDKLTFRLTDLNDSRCPANAVCVWMGEAKTSVELELNGQKGQATLKLNGDRKQGTSDSTSVAVGSRSFVVVLRDVLPYPGTTSDTPRATFVVK